MKKILLLLLLIVPVLKARSQELLNDDKTAIKDYMSTRGGVLKPDLLGFLSHNKKLVYRFPAEAEAVSDVFRMSFYFTPDGKCYKYFTFYKGDKNLSVLTHHFDKRTSGLKRVSKDLKWVNSRKGYEVGITKTTLTYANKPSTVMLMLYAENKKD